ncbi:3'-5' exonuclease [Streptomyces sp. NPDC005407]|uniref:3'-5' exonuclease n=1 Tax=Streptomyces sp. NPDC005407 TaxID=3155340 RepID=UPI0033A99BFB
MAELAFLDTETTGLDPRRHEVWEIAVILRDTNGYETEHLWQIRQTEAHLRFIADPKALRINRYHDRIAVPGQADAADMLNDTAPVPLRFMELAERLHTVLKDAILIGSNPGFDAAFLHRLLGLGMPPWHYRPIDVATLAAGFRHGQAASHAYGGDYAFASDYPSLPYRSYELSRAVGVEPPGPDTAHTALGDARWARDLYDALTTTTQEKLRG